MKEDFIKDVYKLLVLDGMDEYHDIFDEKNDSKNMIEFWVNAKILYNSIDDNNKIIFERILSQVRIDTIATLFAILDGSLGLRNRYKIDLAINDEKNEADLAELFLMYVEELSENEK